MIRLQNSCRILRSEFGAQTAYGSLGNNVHLSLTTEPCTVREDGKHLFLSLQLLIEACRLTFNVCMQPLLMHCSEIVPDTARHYIRVVTSFGWTGLNDARRENRNRIVRVVPSVRYTSTKRSSPGLALTCWEYLSLKQTKI